MHSSLLNILNHHLTLSLKVWWPAPHRWPIEQVSFSWSRASFLKHQRRVPSGRTSQLMILASLTCLLLFSYIFYYHFKTHIFLSTFIVALHDSLKIILYCLSPLTSRLSPLHRRRRRVWDLYLRICIWVWWLWDLHLMTFMICMYDEFAKHFAWIKVEIKAEDGEFDGWWEKWDRKKY